MQPARISQVVADFPSGEKDTITLGRSLNRNTLSMKDEGRCKKGLRYILKSEDRRKLNEKRTVKCWEFFRCKERECPAYKSKDLKCWLFSGTHCRDEIQGKFLDKIELCLDCRVFNINMDVPIMRATLEVVNRQLREFSEIVEARDRELESMSMELAIGLSEVFEALRKISSGDTLVKISEESKIELISKLKNVVNKTAEEIKEIVDLSHEFAIVLAEHFDVLHRVSKGDLNARVDGGSQVEILESLKKVTNEMIESISREITKRMIAEEALRKSEERYRVIFESTGTPTLIVEEDMLISMANKEFERFSGYRKEEIEHKKSLLDFVIKDDLERIKDFDCSRKNGLKADSLSYEFRFINKKRNIKDVIAIISDIPGTKLKVISLLEITERKQREMEAIVTITTALRSASTYSEMLPIVIDQLMDLLKADGASLAMRDPVSEETVIEIARGEWANWTGVRLSSGEGVSGLVIETGQPYLNNDVKTDPRLSRPELIGNLRAVACVPFIAQGRIIGAIWVGRKSLIAEYEVGLITAIGEIAANAIHRATLHEQTEQRLHRLSALHAIDMAISASLDLRVTLNILLEHVTNQLHTDAATVLFFNPSTQTLEYAASRGFRSRAIQKTRLKLGEGHAGRAALERRIISIPNVLKTEDPCVRSQILAGEVFIAHHAVPLIAKGQIKGVLEVFHRSQLIPDPEWLEFFEALAAQAAIAIDNASLFDELQRSNIEISLAYDSTLEGWSHALDMRDKETEGHTLRVTEMTLKLARRMGISEADLVHIRRGALLHDIGKMGIPDSILLNNGPLTAEEYEIISKHPVYAYEMLLPISFLRQALNIPLCHHEKWDGTGYPRGLKGEQIPFEARIFAVVDVWDAMRTDRVYRPALSEEETLEYIKEQSGKHFDPKVVEAFLKLINKK
jgi:PAS domain S-box-containing protein/putative nucleotidyltransferase with HDIG domain